MEIYIRDKGCCGKDDGKEYQGFRVRVWDFGGGRNIRKYDRSGDS